MHRHVMALLFAAAAFLLPFIAWADDQKISQLETAAPLNGPDEFPLNQAGTTKKATLSQVDSFLGVTDHKNNATIHRTINDSGTGNTDLWSASKITTMLGGKANTSHTHSTTDLTSGVVSTEQGGTGLNTINANKLLYSSAPNTFAELSPGSSLNISGGNLNVSDNSSTQRIIISQNGSGGGTRRQINLIEGSGVSIIAVDNPGSDRVDVTLSSVSTGYPTGFRASAAPVYASTTTFTQAYIRDRDVNDTANITKNTSTTVDITTTGLNGIAQSVTLAGAVSVTNASAVITGASTTFTSDYIVGDVICVTGAQCRRITVISSNTSMTAESNFITTISGTTYRRGGRAPNTHLFEYTITDGSTVGTILSTRNVTGGQTLVDLPAGYTISRQQAFSIRLNSSNNILEFYVAEGWPYRPRILYNTDFLSDTTDPTNVLTSGSAGSFTAVNLANFVPPISQIAIVLTQKNSVGQFYMRPGGSSLSYGVTSYEYDNGIATESTIKTSASQTIEYRVGGGNLDIGVRGFIVTEVP